MIEFKADCGHTIRAKDDDEGKVVRCSYCGRTTQVPSQDEDEFESLFADMTDVESGGSVSAGQTVRQKRKRKPRSSTPPGSAGGSDQFNPFGMILKMVYAAGILIVVIFCVSKAMDYFEQQKARPVVKNRGGRQEDSAGRSSSQSGNSRAGASNQRGVLNYKKLDRKREGIFVSSVPTMAMVRVRKVEDRDEDDEIFLDAKATAGKTNNAFKLEPGSYEVGIGLPINNPQLMRYDGYPDVRRLIENGGSRSLMEAFFLPDGSAEISVVDLPSLRSLVVRTYEIEVSAKQWRPLTAQFLPDAELSELIKFLPHKNSYGFDQAAVERELTFYGVQDNDQTYVIDALRRVGTAVLSLDRAGEYRRFVIDPMDGMISHELFKASRRVPRRQESN